jgi:uncharacterized protein (TIGR02996 family)
VAPPVVLDELWDAFWRDPSDEALRLVLADALQSVGDPRGEFIAIQAAIAEGRASAAARQRASQLFIANVDRWSGPVYDVERASRRFSRGFLVGARITEAQGVTDACLAREWRTIEELSIDDRAASAGVSALVRTLPLLRVFSTPREDALRAVAGGLPLPSLRALGEAGNWLPPPANPSLPGLAVLLVTDPKSFGAWDFAWFRERVARVAPLGLRALVFKRPQIPDIARAIRCCRKYGPPELRLALSWQPGFRPDGWRVRASRDSRRVDIAWAGGPDHERGELATMLSSLTQDDACREVSVDLGPRPLAPGVDEEVAIAALEAGGVTVRFDGTPIDLGEVPA